MSLERRLDLINWAAETGKWIIEDDYDSEFHYDGLPTTCVQGLDKYQRTLYVGTFGKTLYPGLRMGYMALPHQLVAAFTNARSILDGHTPQILQLTLARFMEAGLPQLRTRHPLITNSVHDQPLAKPLSTARCFV